MKSLFRSFTGGEVSPEFWMQVADAKRQTGLATCRNFVCKPWGPIENRAGFKFVAEVKGTSTEEALVVYDNFIGTGDLVNHVGEVGATWARPAGFGVNADDGIVLDTGFCEMPATHSGEALAYPSGSLGGAQDYTIEFSVKFESTGGTTMGIYLYEQANVPADANIILQVEQSSDTLISGVSMEQTFPYGFADDTAYVITLDVVGGQNITLSVNGVVQGTSIRTAPMAEPFGFEIFDATGASAVKIGYFKISKPVEISSQKARLIPFIYSITQSMAIEMGAGYFRFHTMGDTLLGVGGVPYEIGNPYDESELFDVHYVQSADVMTLVHPNHPPMELRRLSATNWTLTVIQFASTLNPPAGVSAAATGGTGTTYQYVVTAVGQIGIDESLASSSASCDGSLFTTGAYNTVSWSSVPNAQCYNVYKFSGGLYGYIGQTQNLTFTDDNIAADTSATPPIATNPFPSAGNYPGAVSYYEQRRVFAGTDIEPQNIWMTKSGTESNMNYSLPTRDDDSIQFRVAAREANLIRHIVPLAQMLLLTSAAEWRITSVNSDAITPSSINVKPQSYIGAAEAQPVIVNANVVYAAARGGHVRELTYSWQAQGFQNGDLSLRAQHLFDDFSIVDIAYSKSIIPIVWMVSSSGVLLGVTYLPEQEIAAWHQHTTQGNFESCCAVPEGDIDVLYVIVNRTINGVQKRYIECIHDRRFTDPQDAFFVDAGLTYSGVAATTISGLDHLEGATVSVLGDGAVMPQQVVSGGAITLPQAVKKAQIGLPYDSDAITLPLAFEIDGYGQGRPKNVNKVWLRVTQSSGIWAGPTLDRLRQLKQRTSEPYGAPPMLVNEEVSIDVSPSWSTGGALCVRQSDPLPLTIEGFTVDFEVGG